MWRFNSLFLKLVFQCRIGLTKLDKFLFLLVNGVLFHLPWCQLLLIEITYLFYNVIQRILV